jgi:hypothetical protein
MHRPHRCSKAPSLIFARIGGSHAQREVFEDSLIIAYLRSQQQSKAAGLLSTRLGRRPSPRDEVWLAQCR